MKNMIRVLNSSMRPAISAAVEKSLLPAGKINSSRSSLTNWYHCSIRSQPAVVSRSLAVLFEIEKSAFYN